MKKRLFLPVFLAFLTFSACQKDSFQQANKDSQVLLTSQNPFNYVGLLHNEGLDFIIRYDLAKFAKSEGGQKEKPVSYRSESLNWPLIDTLTVAYFVDIVQSSATPSSDVPTLKQNCHQFLTTNLAYYHQCETESCFTDLQQALAGSSLSTEARNKIIGLANAVDSDGDNLTNALNIITTHENEIMGSNLSTYEKDILLIGCSVYRSSLQYWHEVYINGQTPWYINYNGGILPRRDWWAFTKRVARADAGGALGGAIRGVYTGVASGALVFGPGGVVATAVGGAVIGGISASAGTAIIELLF